MLKWSCEVEADHLLTAAGSLFMRWEDSLVWMSGRGGGNGGDVDRGWLSTQTVVRMEPWQ